MSARSRYRPWFRETNKEADAALYRLGVRAPRFNPMEPEEFRFEALPVDPEMEDFWKWWESQTKVLWGAIKPPYTR